MAPELSIDIFSNELQIDTRNEMSDATVVFRRFAGAALGSVEGHTPIGAFGLGIKMGGMYISSSEPNDGDASLMLGVRLRHTAFVSEQLFLRTTAQTEYVEIDLGDHRFTEIGQLVISLGYHWAGLEGLVRSWF